MRDIKETAAGTGVKPHSLLNIVHRGRRTGYDQYGNRYNDDEDEDLLYDNEDDEYDADMKAAKRKESNIRTSVDKWIKLSDHDEVLKETLTDPLHLDLYDIKMAKSPLKRLWKPTSSSEERLKSVTSNLSRLRLLEKRLRHIEEMKKMLKERIWELQEIKQEERNKKMKIENEMAAAEREWKYNLDRLNPGLYRPLDRLGDSSHIY